MAQINPYSDLSRDARELCIKRMERTLSRKPRAKKTRLYISSLSGNPESPRELWERCRDSIVYEIAAQMPAKERRAERAGAWNCRMSGRQDRYISGPGNRVRRSGATRKQLRSILLLTQEGYCALCGEPLPRSSNDATLDHVIPLCLTGSDTAGNLVLAHRHCNAAKANDAPTGCEMIWLLNVNARLGLKPDRY